MDDTLLNDERQISDYTLAVLKRAMKQGIRVVLASGRAGASMRSYVNEVGTKTPYIACNGAEIIDPADHQLLDGLMFSVEQAKACARFAEENGFYVHSYEGEHFYFAGSEAYGREYGYSSSLTGIKVDKLSAYLHAPTSKLLCVGQPEDILKLLDKARSHFGDTVSLSISKPIFMEMMPPGSTKGTALQKLSAYAPIDAETTIAFGDSLNDLTMLKWVKYGVAMENARPEIKSIVSLVCPPNNQDGVARYIARHVLKEDVPA